MSLRAVRRIQSGGRLGWLGWPFTCIPNFEPKAFKRHGIRQLQSYLTSVPHMYNELVSGISQSENLRIFLPPIFYEKSILANQNCHMRYVPLLIKV